MSNKNVNINFKDTKGFWEYNDTQKPSKFANKNEEQNVKLTMRPGSIFDPKMIDNYINPKSSKEEFSHCCHLVYSPLCQLSPRLL